MIKKRFASIDLGTNTFHILIAEKQEDNRFVKVFQKREYVYLGKDGVGHINEESFQKGIETLTIFQDLMQQHQVSKYRITGTATLRRADNGPLFCREIKSRLDLDIDIIDGKKEAEYIYKGVRSYLSDPSGKYLIMDIGGGSVEFIHFDQEKMLFSQSFPIGISVLYNKFQRNDPLTAEEIEEVENWLQHQLKDLEEYIENQEVHTMIGSAGSFEVINAILEKALSKENVGCFTTEEFLKIYEGIIPLSKEERIQYPGIPEERVTLIPIAIVLIRFVLIHFKIGAVLYSPYALKEGVISEMIT